MAASFDLVKSCIDFPVDLSGKVIIDIGGGRSLATKELRQKGARAYSLDFRYKDLDLLREFFQMNIIKGSILRYSSHARLMSTSIAWLLDSGLKSYS